MGLMAAELGSPEEYLVLALFAAVFLGGMFLFSATKKQSKRRVARAESKYVSKLSRFAKIKGWEYYYKDSASADKLSNFVNGWALLTIGASVRCWPVIGNHSNSMPLAIAEQATMGNQANLHYGCRW